MRLKPIYEYLGDTSDALNSRAISRCPSCCPPVATLGVVAQEVGDPIGIAGVTSVTYIDTVAMDAHRYVIAAAAGGGASNKGVWIVVVEAGTDGVVTEFKTLQRLDSGVGLAGFYLSVTRFTATEFVVFFQDTTPSPNRIYGLMCTLNTDNTVTLNGARQLLDSTTYGFNVSLRSSPIDGTRVLLARQTSTADGNGYRPVEQAVVTLTGTTLSIGSFTPVSDYNSQFFDVCQTETAGTYAAVGLSRDGGAFSGHRLLRSSVSGTTVSAVDQSDDESGLYTGSDHLAIVQIPGDTDLFMLSASTVTGSAVRLVLMKASTGELLYSSGITRQYVGGLNLPPSDIAMAVNWRGNTYLACVYLVVDSTAPTEYKGELEMFEWNGTALVSLGVTVFDTQTSGFSSSTDQIRISELGLSDTRFPVAYIHSSTIKTFTFEFGNQ